MSRNELRVRSQRERKDVERLTGDIASSGGFGFVYSEQELFAAFCELLKAGIDDFEEQEKQLGRRPENVLAPEMREKQINDGADCAFSYFKQNASEKFRTSFMELISESLAFSDSVYLQRSGADEGTINQARPTSTDLQQNVLWWSIQRQRRLHARKREDGSEWIERNPDAQLSLRAVYEIFNNLVLWAYDHNHLQDLLRESMRSVVDKYDNPDAAAFNLANEAAELIWENIEGAAQAMSAILVTFGHKLVFQSLAQRQSADRLKNLRQVKSPISATKLREIADPYLDAWFGAMSVNLNQRGRPSKEIPAEDRETERTKFIEDVRDVITKLKRVNRGIIGLKLGYGKSRNDLEPSKPAAAKALRERAKRLGVDIDALIREKKGES